jgi:hypothetical protein
MQYPIPRKDENRKKKRLAGTPVLGSKEEKKRCKKANVVGPTPRGIIVELVSSHVQGRKMEGLRTPVADRDSEAMRAR